MGQHIPFSTLGPLHRKISLGWMFFEGWLGGNMWDDFFGGFLQPDVTLTEFVTRCVLATQV